MASMPCDSTLRKASDSTPYRPARCPAASSMRIPPLALPSSGPCGRRQRCRPLSPTHVASSRAATILGRHRATAGPALPPAHRTLVLARDRPGRVQEGAEKALRVRALADHLVADVELGDVAGESADQLAG